VPIARLNESRIASWLGDAYAVRASPKTAASLHAPHGTALFVGLDADVTIDRHTRGRAVLVPPDALYEVHSPGPVIGICFDPERLPRVAARARAEGGPRALTGRLAKHLVAGAVAHRGSLDRPDVLSGLGSEAAASLGRDATTPPRVDRRVALVVERLRGLADDAPAGLAISPAHLQALFVRDTGIAMRTYRLWRRLLAALVVYTRSDATTAAHAAGFADLAHFSRTCRRMLGYAPTVLRDGMPITPA